MNCPAHLDGLHSLACTLTDPHPGYGHRYELPLMDDARHLDAKDDR